MKKVLISLALGAVAGMVVAEIPCVQNFLNKGKKKMENLVK